MKAIRIHKFNGRRSAIRRCPGARAESRGDSDQSRSGVSEPGRPRPTQRYLPYFRRCTPAYSWPRIRRHSRKLGAGVNEYQIGQRVVAYPSLGGYAEYAVAKTSEVRPVPDGVTSTRRRQLPSFSPRGSAC